MLRDIGFSGYANLETDANPNQLEADMRKNLTYIRNIMKQTGHVKSTDRRDHTG
ncbi:MAG TPA: hypothetical protein VNB49_04470 [Candidatus Dormibacteraeota bacterium]|nr:hypothetical protein [Candidatus Dormibacteraeota bacterium]